uniref:FLYWCH-type domain-containing protein n=1 Tax=Elaeophora elaphi TaxID=1147741 RepID=A0A0R3RS33_9BILA
MEGSNKRGQNDGEDTKGSVSAGTSSFSLDITARGRPLIIFKGYEHRQVRVDRARNLKAYRCIKKKCKGRLHTDYNDTNVRIVSEHVHEPNFDAEFKRRRRTLLRELAQKGNVSPSQIIQKARDLEMQYHDVCEATKTSYAAERRYIQRYWNRQKQQEFSSANELLPIKHQIMDCNSHLKIEQEEYARGIGEESVDGSSLFPGDSIQISEQFSQFFQMTTNGTANGNGASAVNVYLNLLLQQMLSSAIGNSSNGNRLETDDYCSSNPLYPDQFSSVIIKPKSVDVGIQTDIDEFDSPVHDGAVRDTLALELGTILAKKFWPPHYNRDDKLKLLADVIGKLLGQCFTFKTGTLGIMNEIASRNIQSESSVMIRDDIGIGLMRSCICAV